MPQYLSMTEFFRSEPYDGNTALRIELQPMGIDVETFEMKDDAEAVSYAKSLAATKSLRFRWTSYKVIRIMEISRDIRFPL